MQLPEVQEYLRTRFTVSEGSRTRKTDLQEAVLSKFSVPEVHKKSALTVIGLAISGLWPAVVVTRNYYQNLRRESGEKCAGEPMDEDAIEKLKEEFEVKTSEAAERLKGEIDKNQSEVNSIAEQFKINLRLEMDEKLEKLENRLKKTFQDELEKAINGLKTSLAEDYNAIASCVQPAASVAPSFDLETTNIFHVIHMVPPSNENYAMHKKRVAKLIKLNHPDKIPLKSAQFQSVYNTRFNFIMNLSYLLNDPQAMRDYRSKMHRSNTTCSNCGFHLSSHSEIDTTSEEQCKLFENDCKRI